MYTISQELADAFKNFAPQKARVTVLKNGEKYVVASDTTAGSETVVEANMPGEFTPFLIADYGEAYHEDRISIGGLSINRYCATNNEIEIGNASSAELTLTLNNSDPDDPIDVTRFKDSELFVEVGIVGIEEWVPMGYFVVDEIKESGTQVSITALDRMVYLDKEVDTSVIEAPLGIWRLLEIISEECGITLSDDFTFPEYMINPNYRIEALPEDYTLTYRQLLIWAAQIMGIIVNFDRHGELQWNALGYDAGIVKVSMTPAERFSSEIAPDPVTLTGIKAIDGDTEYLAGSEGYIFSFSNNKILTHNQQDVVDIIWNGYSTYYPGLKNVTPWYPFSAEIVPMPHIDMYDRADYIDKNGTHRNSYITDHTFKLNANTRIACKGDTSTFKRQTISPYNATGGVSVSAGTSTGGSGLPMLQGSIDDQILANTTQTYTVNCPISYVGAEPIPLVSVTGAGHYAYINSFALNGDTVQITFAVKNENNTNDDIVLFYLIVHQ